MYPYNFPLAPPPGYEYDDGYDGAGPPPAPPPSGPTLPSQPLPGHLLPTPAPAPPPPQPLRPLMYPPEYPYPYYPYVPVYQYPMAPPVEEPVAALNYKPIQTKRNVKPRINKIEGSHPGPAHASQSTAHASHASHATPGGSTTRGHGQGAAPRRGGHRRHLQPLAGGARDLAPRGRHRDPELPAQAQKPACVPALRVLHHHPPARARPLPPPPPLWARRPRLGAIRRHQHALAPGALCAAGGTRAPHPRPVVGAAPVLPPGDPADPPPVGGPGR